MTGDGPAAPFEHAPRDMSAGSGLTVQATSWRGVPTLTSSLAGSHGRSGERAWERPPTVGAGQGPLGTARAESVGFEPTARVTPGDSFQDCSLRPLGQLSGSRGAI